MRSSHDNTIEAINIPFIPRQVRPGKLYDGLVLKKDTITKFKTNPALSTIRAEHPSGYKKSRKRHQLPLSIIIAPEYLYAIFCQFGEGSEGKIKWVQNLDTGEWAALKVLINGDRNVEYNNLESLGKLVTSKNNGPIHFLQHSPKKSNTNRREYFIMKANRGISLFDYIENYKSHPVFILEVALNILRACRQLSLYHGDIKPENMMINPATGEVELIDFGFSRKPDESGLLSIEDVITGTPKYMAPELWIHNAKNFGLDLDEEPFKSIIDIMKSKNILPDNIVDIDQPILSAEKISIYSIGIMLNELFGLTRCYDTDFIPSKQSNCYTRNEIFSIKQINIFFDLLEKMQHPNPDMRPTYEEAIAGFTTALEKITKNAPPFNISLLDIDSEIEQKDPLFYLCIHKDELDAEKDIGSLFAHKKNKLMNNGYAIADTAFIYTSKAALADHIQKHYEKDRFGRTDYYDCKDGHLITIDTVASPSHFGLFSSAVDATIETPVPEMPSLAT